MRIAACSNMLHGMTQAQNWHKGVKMTYIIEDIIEIIGLTAFVGLIVLVLGG